MRHIRTRFAAVSSSLDGHREEVRRTKPIRRSAVAAATAVGLLSVGLPAAEAGAATPPKPPTSPHFGGTTLPFAPLSPNALPSLPALDFTPPAVGEISVTIGPVIIGGKIINPGLIVTKPPVTIPTS
jgi:hypothetical protein